MLLTGINDAILNESKPTEREARSGKVMRTLQKIRRIENGRNKTKTRKVSREVCPATTVVSHKCVALIIIVITIPSRPPPLKKNYYYAHLHRHCTIVRPYETYQFGTFQFTTLDATATTDRLDELVKPSKKKRK